MGQLELVQVPQPARRLGPSNSQALVHLVASGSPGRVKNGLGACGLDLALGCRFGLGFVVAIAGRTQRPSTD